MTNDPLQGLLEPLCRGDLGAAERAFLQYEPYLRLVVRRQLPAALRAKFDSVDVVQSVWADVLQGLREAGWRFASTAQLQAFLVKATRNRFIDRTRRYRAEEGHERPGRLDQLVPAHQPPSEEASANELWERMLALCPPDHRDILRLRRQGHSLREVAERTGLHEGSVRRILRTLARQLALQEGPPQGGPSRTGTPRTEPLPRQAPSNTLR
jgi:RNA polymerase sigma factor (sigma-70 family)